MKPSWYVVQYAASPPTAAPVSTPATKDVYCARLKAEKRAFVVYDVAESSAAELGLLEALVCASTDKRVRTLIAPWLNRQLAAVANGQTAPCAAVAVARVSSPAVLPAASAFPSVTAGATIWRTVSMSAMSAEIGSTSLNLASVCLVLSSSVSSTATKSASCAVGPEISMMQNGADIAGANTLTRPRSTAGAASESQADDAPPAIANEWPFRSLWLQQGLSAWGQAVAFSECFKYACSYVADVLFH
jgi:hypothetical protein